MPEKGEGAGMGKLRHRGAAVAVDASGEGAEIGDRGIVERRLVDERPAIAAGRAIGDGRQRGAAGGDIFMEFRQAPGDHPALGNAFVGRRLDETVAQAQRSDRQWRERRSAGHAGFLPRIVMPAVFFGAA